MNKPMKARGVRMTDEMWASVLKLTKKMKCKPSEVIRRAIMQLLGDFE
jgi:hypothetical protein